MGICDSFFNDKKHSSFKLQNQLKSENIQNSDIDNDNDNENDMPTNSEIYLNAESLKNNMSSIQEIDNNKCPELAKYDQQSLFYNGKKSEGTQFNNKTHSFFSSGQTEEEVIIKGEINKNCKNKEEDFDNNSFKKLVKNNGGIIIKNDEKKNNIIYECKGKNTIIEFYKENISEMKSKHSFPFMPIKRNIINNNKLGKSWSNVNLIKNINSENNQNIIDTSLKNNNLNISNLRDSIKINNSLQDNSMLIIPKMDEPLPDIDELSTESRFVVDRNSLVSE